MGFFSNIFKRKPKYEFYDFKECVLCVSQQKKQSIFMLIDQLGKPLSKFYAKMYYDGFNFIANYVFIVDKQGNEIYETNLNEILVLSDYKNNILTLNTKDFLMNVYNKETHELTNSIKLPIDDVDNLQFIIDDIHPTIMFVDTSNHKFYYKHILADEQVYGEETEDLWNRLNDYKNQWKTFIYSDEKLLEYLKIKTT